jgi:hypothetical protein
MAYPFPKKPSVIAGDRGKNPAELEDKITLLLSNYARTGLHPTYTDEQIIRILKLLAPQKNTGM